MTAQSRDELLPAYHEAEKAFAEATRKLHEARELRDHVRDQLTAASRREAQGEIGKVLKLSRGTFKITRMHPHWLDASVMYPVMVQRNATGKTWGKRETHGYGWRYNFELSHWEYGTVVAGEGFKPQPHPMAPVHATLEHAHG